MKVLITGASGLVGGELVSVLEAKGFEIYKLSRSKPQSIREIQWDAYNGFETSELNKLEGIEVVVHLAGENVGGGSWTKERKRRIKDSRIKGTRTLVSALANLENPPKTLVSASAVGFYGNRYDEVLTEESKVGEGFLSEVCEEWEDESKKAKEFGARVVIPRIGIVLTKKGGAIEKMLTPFKFGVGGTVGSGEQWMSWITIDDLIKMIVFVVENENVRGVLNATTSNPVRNKEFTDTLGKVINRPTIIPVPSFGIKLLFGEMGERLLLEGCRVLPKKLQDAGFEFDFPKLEDAMKHVINS